MYTRHEHGYVIVMYLYLHDANENGTYLVIRYCYGVDTVLIRELQELQCVDTKYNVIKITKESI